MIVRKSVVFDIDKELWDEFSDLVESLGSYKGRVFVRMVEYVLKNKEDFAKFVMQSREKVSVKIKS